MPSARCTLTPSGERYQHQRAKLFGLSLPRLVLHPPTGRKMQDRAYADSMQYRRSPWPHVQDWKCCIAAAAQGLLDDGSKRNHLLIAGTGGLPELDRFA
jgi:hypothetical protein